MNIAFSAPLVAVASVAALLFTGLHRDPGLAASPSDGKPLPEFVLPISVREWARMFRPLIQQMRKAPG